MLNSDDSPYIRAIGFLYLRYGCNPRNIWEWIQEFVDDEVRLFRLINADLLRFITEGLESTSPRHLIALQEEFSPSPYADPITMGAFVRDIFLDMYYFETILPRIPQHILVTPRGMTISPVSSPVILSSPCQKSPSHPWLPHTSHIHSWPVVSPSSAAPSAFLAPVAPSMCLAEHLQACAQGEGPPIRAQGDREHRVRALAIATATLQPFATSCSHTVSSRCAPTAPAQSQ